MALHSRFRTKLINLLALWSDINAIISLYTPRNSSGVQLNHNCSEQTLKVCLNTTTRISTLAPRQIRMSGAGLWRCSACKDALPTTISSHSLPTTTLTTSWLTEGSHSWSLQMTS
jgi:hypothetical protein